MHLGGGRRFTPGPPVIWLTRGRAALLRYCYSDPVIDYYQAPGARKCQANPRVIASQACGLPSHSIIYWGPGSPRASLATRA